MADKAMRAWSAKCNYEGKKQFYLGTITMPKDAKQHEIDAALLGLWGDLSPHPAPPMVATPGMVIFVPEEDN